MIAMAVGNEAVHGIGEHSRMPVCVIYTVSALKSNNSSPPKSAYRQERILRPPAARGLRHTSHRQNSAETPSYAAVSIFLPQYRCCNKPTRFMYIQ